MRNITDEKVSKYLEGFYRPLTPFLADLRRKAEIEAIPIILKETESFLVTLLRMKRPKQILEIGTAIGYSALCFAEACPEGNVTTLEIREDMRKLAAANFIAAGENRIRMIVGDGAKTLKGIAEESKPDYPAPFDFIFIDGGHGHYLEFWEACMPFCRPGTVIVSDNILFKGMTASDDYLDVRRNRTIMNRMREYLNHITDLKGVSTALLPLGDGLAVSTILE